MGIDAHVYLLLFTSLVALTAEAYPALYKVKPSPIRRYRPTAFAYPHRKLSRPWLVKVQEELWRDGPSGDGAEEDAFSKLISPRVTQLVQTTKSDYKTVSPSAEDFVPSQTELFPTIIDTMIDESSSFPEEFVIRKSILYEGPSSLLNSFIFRPNLPFSSLSSIKTPVIEESSDFQNVIPTWMDKSTVFWSMSPRQALSETVSNEFDIITAISATNIENESAKISFANVSFHRLPFELSTNFTPEESLEITSGASNMLEIPSLAGFITIQTFLAYSEGSNFYTQNTISLIPHQVSDTYSAESIRPNLASQMFLSSDIPVSLQNRFYSNILTEMPYISSYSDSLVFYKTFHLLSSAYTWETSNLYFDETDSLNNPFSTQILYSPDKTSYIKMPTKSFQYSNVQTMLTIFEDESKSDIFNIPFSRKHEVSAIPSSFATDVRNTNPVLTSSKFENVFSYISSSFSDFNEVGPVMSFLPIDSITISKKVDIGKILKTISDSGEFTESYSPSGSELSYPIFSSIRTSLFDNEIAFEKSSSLDKFEPFSTEKMKSAAEGITPPIPFIPSYDLTDVLATDQQFTFIKTEKNPQIFDSGSVMNEIVSDKSQKGFILTSFDLLESSQTLDAITVLTSISDTKKFQSEQFFSEILFSTGIQSNSQRQAMTPITSSAIDIMSINDKTSRNILSPLSTNFIDPSTHHVTVRSLNENSFADINESTLLLTGFSVGVSETDIPIETSRSNLNFVSERSHIAKSENIYSSNDNLLQTVPFDEHFKTEKLTADYFPLTRTIISELSNCDCFESSLLFEKSEIYPSLSSLYKDNKNEEITPTNIYSSTSDVSDEIHEALLESSLSNGEMGSEPTKILTNLYGKSLKDIATYTSDEKALDDQISENIYMKTSLNNFYEQTIESSLLLSHYRDSMELDKAALSNSPLTIMYTTLDVPFMSPEKYSVSSSISHLNEHLFHSSDRALTESISIDEALNADLHTRTIPLQVSEKTYSTEIVSSDFSELNSEEYVTQLKSGDIVAPTLSFNTVSKYVSSKTDSESFDYSHTESVKTQSSVSSEEYLSQFFHPESPSNTPDFQTHLEESIQTGHLYSFYSELPTVNVYYRSSLDEVFDTNDILVTPSSTETKFSTTISYFPVSTFQTTLHSEILSLLEVNFTITPVLDSEDKLDSAVIKTENQLNTIKKDSNLIYNLYSETISKLFESPFDVVSSFFSEESNLYRSTYAKTPRQLDTAGDESTMTVQVGLDIPSRYIESSIDYTSTLSFEEKSRFGFYTPESNWFNKLHTESESKYLEMSTALVDSFVSTAKLTSYEQIPHQIDNSKEILHEKSIQLSDLLLSTKTKPLQIFSHFSSENVSKIFPVPQITPSKTIKLEETASASQKLIDDELHSRMYPGALESSTHYFSNLNFEKDSFFYDTPNLIPSLSTIMLGQSICELPSCTSDHNLVIRTSDKFTLSSPSIDIKGLVSPTTFSEVHISQISASLSSPLQNNLKTIESPDLQITEMTNIKPSYSKSDLMSKDSDHSLKHTSEYSSTKTDLKSLESEISIKTMQVTLSTISTPLQNQLSARLTTESVGVMMVSSVLGENTTLIPPKESSTPSYDIEMASVLAISSFFGANSSRNASSGFENIGISEDDWSKSDVRPTPSFDVTLFKDNNYWILTVLETPMKGHLPDNFSHTLEVRLANAYSEAFHRRYPKQEGSSEPIIVKILSLTNDLLLSQLNIVYVVEKGGILLPADIASELFNFLRHEQLREFLGLYAILKAKPYRPEEMVETKPVSYTIPVVTIVCSILGFLLLLFCCFCVYCRCCRPKQASETSPSSSASGSLQRSLAKHGQHNRKHLFQEMALHLTTEIASAQRKNESPAKDIYLLEKESTIPEKKLPPLPATEQAETIDKAARMLKILQNKDASTSPIAQKLPGDKNKTCPDEASTLECKKSLPKPKKRKKPKEVEEKKSTKTSKKADKSDSRPPSLVPKKEKQTDQKTAKESRESPDSGTSSRHTSSSQVSAPDKMNEEAGSDGSNTELLPPVKDLIAKSKAESEAAVADTQDHLSRVRQRISDILDDAFALANGRKFYGSMRSKKIDPATEMFPRYASLRSQSAAECSLTRHEESLEDENRRPISEGAQNLLGTITDDGQLITRPPPKSVWDHSKFEGTISDVTKHPEVTEAHNRHVNFFPFQQQSKLQIPSSSTSFTQSMLETQHRSPADMAGSMQSTINVLKEVASAHSSKIHPAVTDQYDEIDIINSYKEDEPVIELIQAIKDELQKFNGSMSGSNNNESNA